MIALRGVSKRFGRNVALHELSLSVAAGEVVGLLGPNGSGKSTTLRIVSGFLDPDQGRAEVAGHSVVEERSLARAMVGYMPESVPLYRDMRVVEYLRFRARLMGVARKAVAERVAAVCATCGLDEVRARIIGQLSKGFRQRVGLADALIAEPPILLLDEPTSGLDPRQVRDFRALIGELARARTVVISSHILSQLETMADRLVVLARGRLVGDGTVAELRARCGMDEHSSLEEVFLALTEAGPGTGPGAVAGAMPGAEPGTGPGAVAGAEPGAEPEAKPEAKIDAGGDAGS